MTPIVVIGRNEGRHLLRSLVAALRQSCSVLYVDSGSTDGSPALAASLGVDVVELDATSPYTAARARNAGVQFLLHQNPDLQSVQFMDGDCELSQNWLNRAESELARRPEIAAVCGRRRERFPDTSVFHKLCDLEWDTPPGDVDYFGGDVLMRVSAFRQAGGYHPELIAGEEPELSVRLRRKGWKIVRLPDEMTLHESSILRFGQWWRRTLRSGHAYAEGAWLHGLEPEHHWLRESLSIWLWGVAIPVTVAATAMVSPRAALLLAALFPALALKIYLRSRRIGRNHRDAVLYAVFCVVAKFPQALGQIRFLAGRLVGRRSRLIEYKLT